MFVRQFDEDDLIILGLREYVPVSAEMACEAIPRVNITTEGEKKYVCIMFTLPGLTHTEK